MDVTAAIPNETAILADATIRSRATRAIVAGIANTKAVGVVARV